MPLDVVNIQDTLIAILQNNTATMAASLTTATAISTIRAGDARSAPLSLGEYPAIMVKLVSESEEFSQLGQRNNEHKLEWAIVPLIYESSDSSASDEDIMTMTKNIKGVLKSNISLSNTAIGSMPERVDYFPADLDGIFCSAAIITFISKHMST